MGLLAAHKQKGNEFRPKIKRKENDRGGRGGPGQLRAVLTWDGGPLHVCPRDGLVPASWPCRSPSRAPDRQAPPRRRRLSPSPPSPAASPPPYPSVRPSCMLTKRAHCVCVWVGEEDRTRSSRVVVLLAAGPPLPAGGAFKHGHHLIDRP